MLSTAGGAVAEVLYRWHVGDLSTCTTLAQRVVEGLAGWGWTLQKGEIGARLVRCVDCNQLWWQPPVDYFSYDYIRCRCPIGAEPEFEFVEIPVSTSVEKTEVAQLGASSS